MASFVQHGKKIIAIGRNYVAHAKELGNATPKEPFFFLKPTSSYVESGGKVEIPKGVIAHHEVELGLVIGKRGRDISQSSADSYISGYTLAVDMTARNLQDRVKKQGLPWSAAKGFDTFTPIGAFIPKSAISNPDDLRLKLTVNGQVKQDGSTADMLFKIPKLLENVSAIMTLEEGDVVLTGTPSGVGPIVPGDIVECTLSDASGKQLAKLDFSAVQREGGYEFKE
ncbi:mitochondrial protein [Coprinopsis marcescibilis]|uniref:Mitochondrial protein n=1 Tax=Coprinopsis marcescibilis TaxID=230819 RepID=A0A5C3KRY3_COPMA|nr:mitochondrial protein [Coprinopsis marcescibilis]